MQLGDLPWKLVAAIPTEDAFADVGQMRLLMVLALVVIGAVAALAAWRLSASITGPLRAALAGANAIGEGDLDYRIPVRSGDEVGELATSFNEMAASLAAARSHLLQAERRIAYQETSESILQAVPTSLVALDKDGRIAFANNQFCNTFSLAREDCAGQRLSDVVELGPLETEVAVAVKGETAFRGQWTWKDTQGAHYFYVSINPMLGDGDKLHRVILALDEMTDRVAAEQRYRQLMENANDGVFIVDAKTGKIQESNTRAAEMVGVSTMQDLVGRDIATLHPRAMNERAQTHLSETLELGSAIFDDLPLIREDGSELQVQVSAKVVDVGGERLIHSVVRDVTERKEAEWALARFQAILEATPDFVGMADAEGRTLYVNKAGRAHGGIRRGRGHFPYDDLRLPPWVGQGTARSRRSTDGRSRRRVERRDGVPRQYRCRNSSLYGAHFSQDLRRSSGVLLDYLA